MSRRYRECSLLPHVVRTPSPCGHQPPYGGLAQWAAMKNSASSRFPVSVTHLPVVRCHICRRTMAYRPGQLSAVLTNALPQGASRGARRLSLAKALSRLRTSPMRNVSMCFYGRRVGCQVDCPDSLSDNAEILRLRLRLRLRQ